ncbi:MAG: hypothetical protein IT460_07555 [Planctomycetes bacterium]|nr:hypothetical protein [Planctomycetota bacterium]
MRRALVALSVLVPVAVATISLAAPPRRAADRRDLVTAAEKRLDALVAEAKVDARAALVRAYRKYTPEQLADRGRAIDVDAILKIIKDDGAPPEVREEAAGAITWDQALRHDPDLDAVGKGMARPRAKFSNKVLSLLVDNDVFVRGLADGMLKGMWPGVRDPDITTCNVRKPASCSAARNAWAKFLSR